MAHIKPLAIDLFCGLGGWTEGLLAEGYRVVGFDIEQHVYGEARYPAQLVLQDVLTIHGRQFKNAALIVASPPCQEYSYMAMPWSRAKAIAAEYRSGARDVAKLTALFDACFRLQREACEAAGRHIPMVVENVRGAQQWVGRSRYHFGSFHLWGDIPALMPIAHRGVMKWCVGTVNGSGNKREQAPWDRGVKVSTMGAGWYPPRKGRAGFDGSTPYLTNQQEHTGVKCGGDWFNASQPSISRTTSSKSTARKAASAHIAKIPLTLSRHIAKAWYPHTEAV